MSELLQEIITWAEDNVQLVGIGVAVIAATAAYAISTNRRDPDRNVNSGMSKYTQPTIINNNNDNSIDNEENRENKIEIKNISQLLDLKTNQDTYLLTATVKSVHANNDGYAGILSDNTGIMPFAYRDDGYLEDHVAGILLHDSKENSKPLEFIVSTDNYGHKKTKMIIIGTIEGDIGNKKYKVGDE